MFFCRISVSHLFELHSSKIFGLFFSEYNQDTMFLRKALHVIDSRIKKGKKQQSFSSFLFLHFVPICGLCCTLLALFKVQFVNLSKSMA